MALKYYFEFTDVKEILHRCEISSDDFVGDSTQIYGSCSLNKGSISNTLEAVRGSGLTMYLEASTSLSFTDLYTEDDFTYTVKYIRDSVTEFEGFLNPEGLYQDYVADKWIIQLDCVDGFSYLENLSFVNDSTGLPFTGKQKEITIIANCLKRTKLLKNINVSIGIFYTGLADTTCVLDEVYLNTERYVKDDNETYMNCSEVLKSVLEKYSATIVQRNGEWYILRIPDLIGNSELDFFVFDSDGVYDSMNNNVDLSFELGSQIDEYYPHWVNENQSISIKSSVSAYRINYKYGFVKSFIDNIYLENVSGVVDDYTINDGTYLDFPDNDLGLLLDCPDDGATKTLTSDGISVGLDSKINIQTKFTTYDQSDATYLVFKIILTGGLTYYLDSAGEWQTVSTEIRQFNGRSVSFTPPEQPYQGTDTEVTYNIESAVTPTSGTITIEIYSAGIYSGGGDSSGELLLSKLEATPIFNDNGIEGDVYTFQREFKASAKIEANKEVFNGDSLGDSYVGTIFENDQTTPTEGWYGDYGAGAGSKILQIMGQDMLKVNSSPAKIFSGDVFGFVPYMSLIEINNIDGYFLATEYNYDALNNITSLKLVQVYYPLGVGISNTITYDYGNVVEPTIET